MVRLQRVTFTALHQYLGLSAELINQSLHKKKHSSVIGSPVKSKIRDNFITPDNNLNTSNLATADQQPDVSFREPNFNVSQPVPIITRRK